MIDVFKTWINELIGLSVFSVLIELVLPAGKLKKYVYMMLGLLTVFLILSPIVNILDNKDILIEVENAVTAMTNNIKIEDKNNSSIKIEYDQKEELKKNYISNIKTDLKNRVEKYGYVFEEANVFVSQDYLIESVNLKVKEDKNKGEKIMEIGTISKIIDEISKEYGVSKNSIKITKVGGEENNG